MKKRTKVPWAPAAVVALGVVTVGAIVFAQTGRQPATGAAVRTGGAAVRTGGARAEAPAVTLTPVAARRPLSYYTGGVRADLFIAPLPPAPRIEPEKKTPPPAPPPAPAPVNPFADYAYTGTVEMGGQTMALVENTKTREGQYLKEGDTFIGGTVSRVDERMLTIDVAGSPQMMAKTDNFKMTPLDKSAPYLQAGGQPGQPGQPGQAAAPPGVPGAPGMAPPGGGPFPGFDRLPPNVQQRIQERMNSMTPEQREQMRTRFLDRQFEGRGRGRRGRE